MHTLWRKRSVVGVGTAVALLVAMSITVKIGLPLERRQYDIGIATTIALIDTPGSQVVDVGGESGATIASLSARARLLASLMTRSPLREEIARRSGVNPSTLVAISPEAIGASARQAPQLSGASIGIDDRRASVLHPNVPPFAGGENPIIVVETRAPDATIAGRLADESIVVLRAHIESAAAAAALSPARRLVVRRLTAASAQTERRGPGTRYAILAGTIVFVLFSAGILAAAKLKRSWHSDASDESPISLRPRG